MTVGVDGSYDPGAPTPEILIAQRTIAENALHKQDEDVLVEDMNPLEKIMGMEGVAGAVNIHGAALPSFAGHHPPVREEAMQERVHHLFGIIDANADGVLSKDELHGHLTFDGDLRNVKHTDVVKELHALIHKSGRDLHRVFEQLDTDGDQKITAEEFLKLITDTEVHPGSFGGSGIDWENMDPMTGKPVVPHILQKPTAVAAPVVAKEGESDGPKVAIKPPRKKKNFPKHEPEPEPEPEPGFAVTPDEQCGEPEPGSKADVTSGKKIEEELGLTGSEEEAAQIAKMQAQVRGKNDRKKVAEMKSGAEIAVRTLGACHSPAPIHHLLAPLARRGAVAPSVSVCGSVSACGCDVCMCMWYTLCLVACSGGAVLGSSVDRPGRQPHC